MAVKKAPTKKVVANKKPAKKKPSSKQPVGSSSKKNQVTSNIPSLIPPKGDPEKRPSRTEPTVSWKNAFYERRMTTPQSIKSFNEKHFGKTTKKKK